MTVGTERHYRVSQSMFAFSSWLYHCRWLYQKFISDKEQYTNINVGIIFTGRYIFKILGRIGQTGR